MNTEGKMCSECGMAGYPPATTTVETPYWGTLYVCKTCADEFNAEDIEEA